METMIFYTNAPIVYDGFSTRRTGNTVDSIFGKLEEVEIGEPDINWQTMRYRSGGNVILEKDQLQEFQK